MLTAVFQPHSGREFLSPFFSVVAFRSWSLLSLSYLFLFRLAPLFPILTRKGGGVGGYSFSVSFSPFTESRPYDPPAFSRSISSKPCHRPRPRHSPACDPSPIH